MGRGARWALGLVVSGALALGALVSVMVAFGQAVGPGLDAGDPPGGPFGGDCLVYDDEGDCADRYLTTYASAEVLDVDGKDDVRGLDTYGRYGPTVDLDFRTSSQHVITTITWPSLGGSLPSEGDTVHVLYAPYDPERLVTIQEAVYATSDSSTSADGSAVDRSADWGEAWVALWTGAGFGAAAVVALLIAWWWARRAPESEPKLASRPYGLPGYGYPGYSYGYPGYGYGYPGFGSGHPPGYGYPAGYASPVAGRPANGYPGQAAPAPVAGSVPSPGSGRAGTPDGAASGGWPLPG